MAKDLAKSLNRTHWLDSGAIQLPLSIVVGVLAPPILLFLSKIQKLAVAPATNTITGSVVAATLSWYCIEQLRYFAKARRLSYVIPVNITTFGLCFAGLMMLRLPYSNVLGVAIFASTTAFHYFVASINRRNSVANWIVPGGQVDEAREGGGEFFTLTQERLRALIVRGDRRGAIVADLHHSMSPEWEELLAEAAITGIPVYHFRQIWELQTGQVRIDHLRENDLGSLIPNLGYMSAKRAIDVVASIVALPLVALITAIFTIAIKLDSPGPVFYRQTRIGYRGREFVMFKLRSMTEAGAGIAAGTDHSELIRHDGTRVTRVGRFIRRYRIDELPQVLNILLGDMSWIGPRPEAESHSRLYQVEIPFYRYRHIVRPGLTGWAQVNQGHVSEVDEVSAKLRYDFYYVRNISMWLDLLIVLKTVRIILGGFGAR